MTTTMTVRRYSEAVALLNNPAFEVPPVPPVSARSSGDTTPDLAWLRATVSRFASGPDHLRRRALAIVLLDAIDPGELRSRAAAATATALAEGATPEAVALRVPVAALAAALRLDSSVVDHVAVAARGYQPGNGAGPAGDLAVQALVAACGGMPDEITAARIAVMVQAYDATATLIGNALAAARATRVGTTVDGLLAETLRFDPPARVMRRVCVASSAVGALTVDTGTLIMVDIAAANRDPAVFAAPDDLDPARTDVERHLAFGTGIRPCPGRDHALALAAGVLSVLLGTDDVRPALVGIDDVRPPARSTRS
jgi:cytochrome P450